MPRMYFSEEGLEVKKLDRKLLRDSECFNCNENRQGEPFQKMNLSDATSNLILPPSLSFTFSIHYVLWDQYNDFIWGSTLSPSSVHMIQVDLNSAHFKG